MKLIRVFLSFLIIFLNINNLSYAANLPQVNAGAAILIDGKTGMVLYEKNPDKTMYPASTTKIITAIIALEKCDLDEQATASIKAVNDIGPDGMHIGILPGERISIGDLLHALLIRSANETANIIAEHIAGSTEKFAVMMNEKAKELGALNTHFVTPHGHHNPRHYTTVGDMAKIARYAMSIPEFRKIVSKKYYEIPPTNLHDKPNLFYSTNKLLLQGSLHYPEAIGIKTGYTDQAGHNLIGAAARNNIELISVMMGGKESNSTYIDTKNLFEYGFSNFSIQEIFPENHIVSTVDLKNAKSGKKLTAVIPRKIEALMPNDKTKWNVSINFSVDPLLSAPVKKNSIVGSAEYYNDGVLVSKSEIVAREDIEKAMIPVILDFITYVSGILIVRIIFFLLCLIAALRIAGRIRRKRKRRYTLRKHH